MESGGGGGEWRVGRGNTKGGRRPERERRGPAGSSKTVLSPGRVMLPTELKLNPPTQQFGNV